MNDLHLATLRQLAALEPADDVDRITKAALTASLESEIEVTSAAKSATSM